VGALHSEIYSHRYADVILNSDYDIKREIEEVIKAVDFQEVLLRYSNHNSDRLLNGKKLATGKQSTINSMVREQFINRSWEAEKNVFNDPLNDLALDFWKRGFGVDVAFNHRSFIGGDILRLQAAAEVKNIIKVGIYICPTKNFSKLVSPKDASSMVNYERVRWYLDNFYPVFTVPILLIGLSE